MDATETSLWKVAWICTAVVLVTIIIGITITSVSGYRHGYQEIVTVTHGNR